MDQNNNPVSIDKSIKKFRNSLIATFLFIIAVVGIFAAQTYAYFWDTSTSTNKIRSGYLDVDLIEVDNPGGETLDVEPIKFFPGMKVNKSVKVSNTGDLPIYVRIKIEKNITNAENDLPEGWEELIYCSFNVDDESTPDVTEKLWIYRDGYYYYYSKIDPNTITPSLFDEIIFSTEMGNEFTNKQLEFKIICQAVQVNGNSSGPLTAIGWPAESGN